MWEEEIAQSFVICPNLFENGNACWENIFFNSPFCTSCGWKIDKNIFQSEVRMCNSVHNGKRCQNIFPRAKNFCSKCGSKSRDANGTRRIVAQDFISCDICSEKENKNPVEFVCKKCEIILCKECIGLHVSSKPSTLHDITGYKFKEDMGCIKLAGCKVHENKKCELYCKNCEASVCSKCVALNNHSNHKFYEISVICQNLKSSLRKENQVYADYITPEYDKVISDLQSLIDIQKKSYEKIREDISKQGQNLHSEINILVQKLLENANQMEKEDIHIISSSLSEMKKRRSEIQLAVKKNKKLEKVNDAANLMAHSSKMVELSFVFSPTEFSTPKFMPQEIKSDVLANMFGTLNPSRRKDRLSYWIAIPDLLKEEK